MSMGIIDEKDGFIIRLAETEDAVSYYEQNYCPSLQTLKTVPVQNSLKLLICYQRRLQT